MTKAHENNLRKLLAEFPSHDDIMGLLRDLGSNDGHANDRATAIVGATLIEHGLQIAISGSFITLGQIDLSRLFDGDRGGPLATFSHRTLVAYAMGLIGPKSRSDINSIRIVRNTFSHGAFEITFSHPDIASICANFKFLESRSLPPKDSYIAAVALCSEHLRKSIPKQISLVSRLGHGMTMPNPARQHLP